MSSISSIGSSAGQWAQMSATKPPSGGPDPAKMFAKVDTDGSGGVDETELQAMLDKVNERAAAMGGTEVSASDAFSSFDTDGDGSLNASELDTGMKGLMQAQGGPQGAGGPPPMGPPPGDSSSDESDGDSSSSLDKLLSAIDSDKDGNLSAEEIASFKKLASQVAQAYNSSGQSQSASSLCVAA